MRGALVEAFSAMSGTHDAPAMVAGLSRLPFS